MTDLYEFAIRNLSGGDDHAVFVVGEDQQDAERRALSLLRALEPQLRKNGILWVERVA